MITASAPGKIILSGEHAVVYGYPALLASVNRRLTVKLTSAPSPTPPRIQLLIDSCLQSLGVPPARISLAVTSRLPVGAGMGSSAALATAASAALFYKYRRTWDLDRINSLAFAAEKIFHGRPSGADNTISCFGGFLWYRKESDSFKTFSPVTGTLPPLLLINSGRPAESTADMVSRVLALSHRRPQKTSAVFSRLEAVTREWLKIMLGESSAPFSEVIRDNEKLLEMLSIVSPSTQTLIRQIERLGGAAKISGAGGFKSASGLILAYHPRPAVLHRFALDHKLTVLPVKLGGPGVRLNK